MVSPRRVIRMKRQLVVPIPPEHQAALGARPGAVVYWHPLSDGEVVVAVSATRKRGKPPDPQKSAAIAALEAEVYRLNARLDRQRESLWNEWVNQHMLKQLSVQLKGYPALDAINDRLRGIEQDLARLAHREYVRAGIRAPSRRATPAVTATPASAPSPAMPEVVQGAATSGAQLPGGPLESQRGGERDVAF